MYNPFVVDLNRIAPRVSQTGNAPSGPAVGDEGSNRPDARLIPPGARGTVDRFGMGPVHRVECHGDSPLRAGLADPNRGIPRSAAGRGEWRSAAYAGPTNRQIPIRAGKTPIDDQTASDVQPGAISLLDQGRTNACGTTALSMVMRYWQGATPENTVAAIDAEIRPGNYPSDPRDMQAYARSQGLRAGVIRGGTTAQLQSLINQGTPPVIVVWSNPGFHYVAVTGYERTVNGDDTDVEYTLADPASGTRTISTEKLNELWGGRGNQNYLISIAPSGSHQVTGLDGRERRADRLVVYDSRPHAGDALISAAVNAYGWWIS